MRPAILALLVTLASIAGAMLNAQRDQARLLDQQQQGLAVMTATMTAQSIRDLNTQSTWVAVAATLQATPRRASNAVNGSARRVPGRTCKRL